MAKSNRARIIKDTRTGENIDEQKRRQIIIHYLLKGWSFRSIGMLFDVSAARIFKYCKQNHILPAKRLHNRLTEDDIRAERERWGFIVEEI